MEKGDSFAQVSRKEKPEFEFKQYDSGSGVWKLPLQALSGSSSVFKQLVTKNSGYTVGWLRRMKTIKIRVQINEIENTKATERTEKTKRWFLEKIDKIDKTLARLIKKNTED